MSIEARLMAKFLQELNSDEVRSTLESLDILLEVLERKNDPEPFEIQIVDSAYQTLEKLKTLEGVIKQHISESNMLPGNNLQRLYDRTSKDLW